MWLVVVCLVVGATAWTLAEGPPAGGMTQKVGVMVPGGFNARALRKLLEGLLDKGATQVSIFLLGATDEEVQLARAAALLADPGKSRVSVHWAYEELTAALQGVDKVIVLGGRDPQAIRRIPDDFWRLFRQALQGVALVASLGNGLLPLIQAGLLPQGAQVAAPPDESYVNTCTDYGLDPVEPQEWDTDEEGRALYTPPGVYWQGDGWNLFTSSIPDYWYGAGEEEEFGELYDEEIEEFIDALEQAYYGELEPGCTGICPKFPRRKVSSYSWWYRPGVPCHASPNGWMSW